MTRWNASTLAVLALLLGASSALAQRVSVAEFTGDKKGAVRAQVARVLCAQIECVPPSRILTRKKVDFAKVTRARLGGVLTGVIKGPSAKKRLVVQLVSASREVLWREIYPLRAGKLRAPDARALAEAVGTALPLPARRRAAPPPPEEAPAPPPPPEDRPFFSETPREDTSSKPPPAETPPAREESRASATQSTEEEVVETPAATPAETGRARHPFVVADVGLNLMWRNFAYDQLTTGNLLGYRGLAIVAPSFRVEVYPLAFLQGLAEGIGLFGEYGTSIGLSSKLDDVTRFPSTLSWWKAGARWNIRPIAGSTFSFGPELAYRGQNFVTGAAQDGTTLQGLPDLFYRVFEAGLHVDVPLGSFAVLQARGSYLGVLSAADLLGPSFFPNGRGGGVEFEGGIGVYLGLGELLQARLTGYYTHFGLGLSPDAAAAFQAVGASDSYFGGRLSLRLRY